MMLLDGTISFNEKVQRAVLPEYGRSILRFNQLVYTAGYGPTIASSFANELHYLPAYYRGQFDHKTWCPIGHLSVDKVNRNKFEIDESEFGSPVVEPKHRVVVGLLALHKDWAHPKNQAFIQLEYLRNYTIQERKYLNEHFPS